MKYLKIFASEYDYEEFASGEEFVTPNVSIVGSDDGNMLIITQVSHIDCNTD